jgi:RNA polymerase sigma-70 factor (ECF subfamily)
MSLWRLIGKARSEVASVSTTPLPRAADIAQLTGTAREPSTSSDLGWVLRAQRGEPAAVDWLVREHWVRVERLLVRMFGRRQDLEDLVQTTFLETLRALPSFRGDSSLSTFICGIAVRVGLRARRPRKVERESQSYDLVDEPASQGPSAERAFERAEALRRVQDILTRLSEPKRVAFLLWAVEGLHVNDVANAMQASVPATRSRIFYAQRALKLAAARDPYLSHWLDTGAGDEPG